MRKKILFLCIILLAFVLVFIYHFNFAYANKTLPVIPQDVSIGLENRIKDQDAGKLEDQSQDAEQLDDVSRILQIAQMIKDKGKILLIAVINDAYVPFAKSWLCNTMYMGIHEQVLIVVTDTKSRADLAKHFPNVHIAALPGGEEYNGNQEYTHAGYIRITSWRTRILMELIKRHIELLLFEVDCLWFANPIPETQRQIAGYDIAGIEVAQRPGLIGYGYLYLKPTKTVLSVWQKLTEMLIDLLDKIKKLGHHKAISEGDNDQMYLSSLVRRKYAGIRVKLMSLEKFPDGKWYEMDKAKRDKLHPKPLLLNNNWVIGNKVKIERAKKWKHWFWIEESSKCDVNLVNSTVY